MAVIHRDGRSGLASTGAAKAFVIETMITAMVLNSVKPKQNPKSKNQKPLPTLWENCRSR
jgi:hypothetical protein